MTASDPKRLAIVGATELERTLLQAARRERPSPELTARMAAALGISAGAAITATAVPAVAAKTTLAAWVPAGVIAMAVAAGAVGVKVAIASRHPARAGRPAAAASAPRPEVRPEVLPEDRSEDRPEVLPEGRSEDRSEDRSEVLREVRPAGAEKRLAAPGAPAADRRSERVRRRAAPPPAGDLRDQIALVDAARSAVKAGAAERALVLLRRYEVSYPGGAFRPEALALRIEALAQAGRGAESRALAREFLARYPQSPLVARVGQVVRAAR